MTIYNPRDRQAVPQPSVSVEEIPTLSEIYKQDYPPVYYDIDGKYYPRHVNPLIMLIMLETPGNEL